MNIQMILSFLREVVQNNNREWFQAHRAEYDVARAEFEQGVGQLLDHLSAMDPEMSSVTVKSSTYRFYRDTRFSSDKSPYKNHFGAYMNAHGKKALRGGYYLHLEPGNCLLAVGNYWLPTKILTACRNEMMGNIDEWLRCVQSPAFRRYFQSSAEGQNPFWGDEKMQGGQGFGLERLKKCPVGFPRDWEYVDYLRMKDYCAWHGVSEAFFQQENWIDEALKIFKAARPMMQMMNAVIDDYEE